MLYSLFFLLANAIFILFELVFCLQNFVKDSFIKKIIYVLKFINLNEN